MGVAGTPDEAKAGICEIINGKDLVLCRRGIMVNDRLQVVDGAYKDIAKCKG